jgi:hypothetical protein
VKKKGIQDTYFEKVAALLKVGFINIEGSTSITK